MQLASEPIERDAARTVLEPRDRRLRRQPTARQRVAPEQQLVDRVVSEPVRIVAVGMAAGDPEYPLADQVLERVPDLLRCPAVNQTPAECLDQPVDALGGLEQHGAAIRARLLAVEHRDQRPRQSTVGLNVDQAMAAIERDNPVLKDVLARDYARPALDKPRLGQLIDLVSNIRVGDEDARSRDVLGRIYKYFLSQFASAEGKKGGEFYTPRCVVKVLVEMLEPYRGRVYDPCSGSSGMFAQSIEFIRAHASGNGNGGKAHGDAADVYEDLPGFCKSAPLDEVRRHGHVLTPGRYVGAEPQPDDGEPFEAKMQRLVARLQAQQAEGARLDATIAQNLKTLGLGGDE